MEQWEVGFLGISQRFESPYDRLKDLLSALRSIMETYEDQAVGYNRYGEWEFYFIKENFSIVKTIGSTSASIIKYSANKSEHQPDGRILTELHKEKQAIIFLSYVIPILNALDKETRMLIIAAMEPRQRETVRRNLLIKKTHYYRRRANAEAETIMELYLDYYGWQQDDTCGKILPYSTIMDRRRMQRLDPKYYFQNNQQE